MGIIEHEFILDVRDSDCKRVEMILQGKQIGV